MSILLEFLTVIDRLQHLAWVMAPCFEVEDEVSVEIDQDESCYRYRSLESGRTVVRPLHEITLFDVRIEAWLSDLSALMGIEQRRQPQSRCRIPNHLWHLGEIRIAGTHNFAPVFVGRSWKHAPSENVRSALGDSIWVRGGVVLLATRQEGCLPQEHTLRGLDEFMAVVEGTDVFDVHALDRVLRGYVSPPGAQEPLQFLEKNRLKLPHFTRSRMLTEQQARIIKCMWGVHGQPAPAMSWKEVNGNPSVNTGYQSFDDAFGSKAKREEVLDQVKRGRYRVRRNP